MIHCPIGANTRRAAYHRSTVALRPTVAVEALARIGLLLRNCGNRFDDLTVKARGSNDNGPVIDYFFLVRSLLPRCKRRRCAPSGVVISRKDLITLVQNQYVRYRSSRDGDARRVSSSRHITDREFLPHVELLHDISIASLSRR